MSDKPATTPAAARATARLNVLNRMGVRIDSVTATHVVSIPFGALVGAFVVANLISAAIIGIVFAILVNL